MSSNSKKIILVSLGFSRNDNPYLRNFCYVTNTGIHYVNDTLKKHGYLTKLINKVTENYTTEEIIKKIKDIKPDIVLFNQFYTTRHDIKIICSEIPEIIIKGIGGHDATFHSKNLTDEEFKREYKHVDFIWQGEAENGLSDYLQKVNKTGQPVQINNLANRIQNLDDLPILDHSDYSSESAFLVTSRGCLSNGCDFCTTPHFYRDGFRPRSQEHIKQELENIKETGRNHVSITDDNFLGLNKEHIKNVIGVIDIARDMKLKLQIMTSVNQILNTNDLDLLMKFTGVVFKIFIGVDNGDESVIKKIGKNVKVSDHINRSKKAIKLMLENGISPYLGYINFMPESSFNELENSAEFLHDLEDEISNFHYLTNKLKLFEGTKIYEKYRSEGLKFEIDNIDYVYTFLDKRIEFLYSILKMVYDSTNILDFLHYEATHLIYTNQLQHTDTGKKYLMIKRKISNLNYNFFMKALKISKKEESASQMFDLINDFEKEIKDTMYKYKSFIPEIVKKSTYILKEPLKYIDTIHI
jgi:radical SAM superfamily enzyme YgiQ (UPF0313 family)